MSFLPLADLSSVEPSLATSGLPVVGQAAEPAVVRNGSPAAQQAYQEGLDFEQVLVNELAQELTATVSSSGTDSSGDDGSDDDSDDDSSGLLGSDPASSGYESMIPDALTTAIMSAGGTGLALQLAQAIDPSAFAGHGDSGTSVTPAGSGSSAAPAGSGTPAAQQTATNDAGSSGGETQ